MRRLEVAVGVRHSLFLLPAYELCNDTVLAISGVTVTGVAITGMFSTSITNSTGMPVTNVTITANIAEGRTISDIATIIGVITTSIGETIPAVTVTIASMSITGATATIPDDTMSITGVSLLPRRVGDDCVDGCGNVAADAMEPRPPPPDGVKWPVYLSTLQKNYILLEFLKIF